MDTIVIKKVVTALAYPMSVIVLALLLMSFFRLMKSAKLSRFFQLVFLLGIVLGSNPMAARWLTYSLERQYPQQAMYSIAKHDVVIVLGGGLRVPIKPAHHTQLSAGSDRYWYAVQLYRAGKAKKIIVSAGDVTKHVGLESEAVYAKRLLERWGIPSAKIIIEGNSRTTEENHQQVRALIDEHDVSSALLVTSATHMPRAVGLFQELPIIVTPASTDILIRDAQGIKLLDWIPSAGAMQLTTRSLHEYYAIWFRELKALIRNS